MQSYLKKFVAGFKYAAKGICIAIVEQRNLKVQVVIAMLVVALGLYFEISPIEWVGVILSISLVISLELMNTAAENLVDLVTLERSILAGKIKDVAAGAVLLAALGSAIVGLIIFGPYILRSLQ